MNEKEGGGKPRPPKRSIDAHHRRKRELRVGKRLRDPRRQQRVRPGLPSERLFRARVAEAAERILAEAAERTLAERTLAEAAERIHERGRAGKEPGGRSPSPRRV